MPFSVTVKDFDVRFETGPVQRGAARLFRANVEVTERPGAAPRQEVLEVNKPLHIGGTTVHLIGHGYAPKVTVKDAQGNVAFSGPVVMLPQDGNFTSSVLSRLRMPGPSAWRSRRCSCLPRCSSDQGPHSVFPDALNPALFANVWYGPPRGGDGQAGERLFPRPHRPPPAEASRRPAGTNCPQASATVSLFPMARARSSWTVGCAGSSCRSATPPAYRFP